MKNLACILLLFLISRAQAGTLQTFTIFSQCMHKEISSSIILPDNYAMDTTGYPVVYLLHGYGGDYTSWSMVAPQMMTLVDEYNMIIVCPDGGYRSWYLDSPIDTTFKYETYILRELIPYVDITYKTIPDRQHRAITGLSMGGHGGLYLGCRHIDIFGAAGSTSGGVDIRQYTASWDLKERILGDTICCKQNWEENTVINVVDRIHNNDLALVIDCGVDDFFLQVNRDLHAKLLVMGIDHEYIEKPGAHNSVYWNQSINYQLLFFHTFFEKTQP